MMFFLQRKNPTVPTSGYIKIILVGSLPKQDEGLFQPHLLPTRTPFSCRESTMLPGLCFSLEIGLPQVGDTRIRRDCNG